MLNAILSRLDETLAEENAAIRRHDYSVLRAASQRKSQLLLELTRALKNATQPPAADVVARLRPHLEENQRLLGLHLKASGEIGELLAEAVARQQSDGTYAAPLGMTRGHSE